ncbi:hypothetical protein V1281_000868 [Nitrobacteraceae bacterium AZCC 2161]
MSADVWHAPVASHSSVVEKTLQGRARRHRDELRDNSVTTRMSGSDLGNTGNQSKNLKVSNGVSNGASAGCNDPRCARHPIIKKSNWMIKKSN